MLRSLLFIVAFYLSTGLILVLGSWLLFAPRSWAMAALKFHGRVSIRLLKGICGTGLEVRGKEKLPPGPVLVAAKHQSAWDTFGLVTLLRDPAMVMKRELVWIPLYGWFSAKFRMIFVRRETGPAALRRLARDARDRAAKGREIVIFPEGTRRPPGAPPAYKTGVVALYEALGIPCCPVALNSGLFWPRRSLRRYPGTIVVEFLDPIPPGLPRDEFTQKLRTAIETASNRLLDEAAKAPDPPPTLPR
jgi:1-acyl-sn-glycerol-3-phosphate acyltransferase